MNRFCTLLSLFLLCFLTHMSVAWSQTTPGPRMVLKETSVDYKEVDEGEIIKHDFRVINQGDQPLNIEQVKPG